MNIKLYLDTRNKGCDVFPIKFVISHNNRTALLPSNISVKPSQFNADKERVENHPNKVFLNNFLQRRKIEIQEIALKLTSEGKLRFLSATELKNTIKSVLENEEKKVTVFSLYDEIISKNYESNYKSSRKCLLSFCNNKEDILFENINKGFVQDYIDYMEELGFKPHSIKAYISNLRHVFNVAIDRELTSNYPFRNLEIKPASVVHRSLTAEQLRIIMFAEGLPSHIQRWIDMFKLCFCLIGINTIDMYNLKGISSFGRIEYDRAKTGRHYSIKVEPEALEIIKKYGYDFKFGAGTFDAFYNTSRNNIRKFAEMTDGLRDIPLSSYWARHSWATMASDLDIPKEVISHALGHGNNGVTDIYINFNYKKVDEANRKVLDYILYGKS